MPMDFSWKTTGGFLGKKGLQRPRLYAPTCSMSARGLRVAMVRLPSSRRRCGRVAGMDLARLLVLPISCNELGGAL
jgi:hypothetical protein